MKGVALPPGTPGARRCLCGRGTPTGWSLPQSCSCEGGSYSGRPTMGATVVSGHQMTSVIVVGKWWRGGGG